MRRKNRLVSFMVVFFILVSTLAGNPLVYVSASKAGTATYGSGGSNGSIVDLGWIVVMDRIPTTISVVVPWNESTYKNAECQTMDQFRTDKSYIDGKYFDGMTKNSILIVDKASYGNYKHSYEYDGTGANDVFNSKTKVYHNSRGGSSGSISKSTFYDKIKEKAGNKVLTGSEWKAVYKSSKGNLESLANNLVKCFNNFSSLGSNLENYIFGRPEDEETRYLRYAERLNMKLCKW